MGIARLFFSLSITFFRFSGFAAGASNATRFLLFTTQRSGSTWFCDILNRQNGMKCGVANPKRNEQYSNNPSRISEMMIRYSYMKNRVVSTPYGRYNYKNITWDAWLADCKAQFAHAERDLEVNVSTVGFKLMYDQVPPRLENMFVDWLVKTNVAVVHLEREATVLKVVSSYQSPSGHMHETKASKAAKNRVHTPPLNLPFSKIKDQILSSAAASKKWGDRLQYNPGVRYYHVSYEQVIGPAAEHHLRSVIAFVSDQHTSLVRKSVSMKSELQQLHRTSCRDRLAPSLYHKIRASLPSDSKMLLACDFLDAL